jgi:hypothetical protein
MIDKKDIRVGNFLYCDGNTNMKEVLEVREKHLRVKYFRDDIQDWHVSLVEIDRFNPIIVTDDLITKFKFVKENIGYSTDISYFEAEYKVLYVDLNQMMVGIRCGLKESERIKDELVVIFNGDVHGDIHLHYLQNIYNDLTQNKNNNENKKGNINQ